MSIKLTFSKFMGTWFLTLVTILLFQPLDLKAETGAKKSYNVLFPAPRGFVGEGEWSTRLQIASENLGWNGRKFVFCNDWSIQHPVEFRFDDSKPKRSTLPIIFKKFNPDFIVSLYPKLYTRSCDKISNYLTMTRAHHENIKLYGKELLKYDGYLCVPQKIDSFLDFLDKNGKKRNILEFVPSHQKTEYEPIKMNKLFYCGANCDPLRTSKPYHDCLRMLDETGFMNVYGGEGMKNWNLRSYKGELPYDGKSITNAIKEAGIALVLHAQEHLENELITNRIFEAAAAGSVIISDRHGFIMREFKDSVLYIDIDKDKKLPSDEMFRQIYTHMVWVLEHPVEAEKLARKAHSIFSAKFTLEDQLERLGAWHEKLQKELKESR